MRKKTFLWYLRYFRSCAAYGLFDIILLQWIPLRVICLFHLGGGGGHLKVDVVLEAEDVTGTQGNSLEKNKKITFPSKSIAIPLVSILFMSIQIIADRTESIVYTDSHTNKAAQYIMRWNISRHRIKWI